MHQAFWDDLVVVQSNETLRVDGNQVMARQVDSFRAAGTPGPPPLSCAEPCSGRCSDTAYLTDPVGVASRNADPGPL